MSSEHLVRKVEEMVETIDRNMPKALAAGIDPSIAVTAAKYWDCLERLAKE